MQGQSRLFFNVSAVDRTTDNTKIVSYATSIYKNTACLQVITGLSTFYGIVGNKLFVLDCSNGPVNSKPEIKLFPNPAMNYTRLQSTTLLLDNPNFQLRVFDAAGRLVMQHAITNSQLHAGYSLFLGTLASGNYFLKIEGASIYQVIPFIKVN